MPELNRSPVLPRLITQMRANAARGVPNTQPQLALDLSIDRSLISRTLEKAVGKGLITVCIGLTKGDKRCVRHYELTAEGRAYADEQMKVGP